MRRAIKIGTIVALCAIATIAEPWIATGNK